MSYNPTIADRLNELATAADVRSPPSSAQLRRRSRVVEARTGTRIEEFRTTLAPLRPEVLRTGEHRNTIPPVIPDAAVAFCRTSLAKVCTKGAQLRSHTPGPARLLDSQAFTPTTVLTAMFGQIILGLHAHQAPPDAHGRAPPSSACNTSPSPPTATTAQHDYVSGT